MKTTQPICFADLPKDYQALCREFLPRPIHDQVTLGNTLEFVEALAGHESSFTAGQEDYYEILTDMVMAYEATQKKEPWEDHLDSSQRLAGLLEASGWSASDLARFLNLDPSMGGKLVRGERRLTLAHVGKLATKFHLEPAYFL